MKRKYRKFMRASSVYEQSRLIHIIKMYIELKSIACNMYCDIHIFKNKIN